MHAMHDREATELFATHERKTGPFERTVLFPVEMEMKELKASIEAGLLKIVVPKLVEELHRGGSAHVSFVE
jgi:HSP20 family molecular chaperone IbpA